MAGKRHVALENLKKCTPGPGRKKLTPEKKAQGLALKERLKQYIESGEAAQDFEKVRQKMADKAITIAMDRTYGPVRQEIEHSGEIGISIVREVIRKEQS